jgi:hypothetical protein
MVVDMKLAPSEVWAMTISEFLHLLEWTRPRQKGDFAGSLRRADVDRLKALIEAG